jgi:hypothetical protein
MAQKRRGNGEGSIYQRSDGTWCSTYSAGYNSHGKRVRRTIFGVTREEARAKLTKILSTKPSSGPNKQHHMPNNCAKFYLFSASANIVGKGASVKAPNKGSF